MDTAEGVLKGSGAQIPAGSGAAVLISKGHHGTPRSGGALDLTLVEAAYLVETGRLVLKEGERKIAFGQILTIGSAREERFEVRYLVYRDFRERGYVIREEPKNSGLDFTVRPRGASAKAASKFWVLAVSERTEFRAADLFAYAERARGLGKAPLVAVVDEEGDLTYYEFATGLPEEKKETRRSAEEEGSRGALVGNHVAVSGAAGKALHGEGDSYGKPLGPLLQLSLIEAVYLNQEGRLDVVIDGDDPKPMTAHELEEYAKSHQRDFELRLSAYRAMRKLGLLPKTGFKYGAHFRVYERAGATPHARYLVHAVPQTFACPWPELSRAVRLAHGVKKRTIFALVEAAGEVRFLQVARTRP